VVGTWRKCFLHSAQFQKVATKLRMGLRFNGKHTVHTFVLTFVLTCGWT
jgi:hypothetical protein